jgi:hypothetical protein
MRNEDCQWYRGKEGAGLSAAAHASAACFRDEAIEAPGFAGLRDELANPIAVTEYVRVYNEERRPLAREACDEPLGRAILRIRQN